MLTYFQSTGRLERDGALLGTGYAGRGEGKNNPLLQNVANTGPLPRGFYTLSAPIDTVTHGPYVLWLTPDPGNDMFGRFGFGIHGDSVIHPGNASEGCIVIDYTARMGAWEDGETEQHRIEVME